MTTDPAVIQGRRAEACFLEWLQASKLPFLYVDQNQTTFSTLFPAAVKRPDFLLLLNSIGFIAIDVKYRPVKRPRFTDFRLDKDDVNLTLAFERIFRIPVWFAFCDEFKTAPSEWRWISALKALEVGAWHPRHKDQKPFLGIEVEDCVGVVELQDLGKLFSHVLKTVDQLVQDVQTR